MFTLNDANTTIRTRVRGPIEQQNFVQIRDISVGQQSGTIEIEDRQTWSNAVLTIVVCIFMYFCELNIFTINDLVNGEFLTMSVTNLCVMFAIRSRWPKLDNSRDDCQDKPSDDQSIMDPEPRSVDFIEYPRNCLHIKENRKMVKPPKLI